MLFLQSPYLNYKHEGEGNIIQAIFVLSIFEHSWKFSLFSEHYGKRKEKETKMSINYWFY